jgi:hypothetical protein
MTSSLALSDTVGLGNLFHYVDMELCDIYLERYISREYLPKSFFHHCPHGGTAYIPPCNAEEAYRIGDILGLSIQEKDGRFS